MSEQPALTAIGAATSNNTGSDLVYEKMREAILHGHLQPGLAISQVQLAQRLGVSRTPLREALRMLQREGLIDSQANRMVRVAPLSIEDIEGLYAVRLANEALAVRLTVPTLSDEDDTFFDDALSEMAAAAAVVDVDRWELTHRAFHARLRTGGGQRLARLTAELSDHSERYVRLFHTRDRSSGAASPREHGAIVAACHDRDPQRAAVELTRHLARAAITTIMHVAPEHEPALIRSALRAVIGDAASAP
jgi:DNA-binding GntR family transcriptional regulator